MLYSQIGGLWVNKFIIGGNPFSGFSHQGIERDKEMRSYYTDERIIQEWKKSEALGINTLIARTDEHMIRVLKAYRNQGGKLQWFAQTASELSMEEAIQNAIDNKAVACYIHGGIIDNYYANGKMDLIPPAIKRIKDAGLYAGIAGHKTEVFLWAEKYLDCDFYMCSYYNPIYRDKEASHRHGIDEKFKEEDCARMLQTIQYLTRPVIHYKILAAGRIDPDTGFQRAAKAMRSNDMVCVGIFSKDDPQMLEKDVKLLEKYIKKELEHRA
jgi:ethanolamine utilization microcompartment shell protein EutS